MKEFWNIIQVIIAGIGGWLGWFLGESDGLLYTLIAFVAVFLLSHGLSMLIRRIPGLRRLMSMG